MLRRLGWLNEGLVEKIKAWVEARTIVLLKAVKFVTKSFACRKSQKSTNFSKLRCQIGLWIWQAGF